VGKYIDWYLVELEGMLDQRISATRLHELLLETEAHLRDTAAELTASGMTAGQAELAALERFGKARDVAASVIHPGRSFVKSGAGVAVLGLLGFAFTSIYYIYIPWQHANWTVQTSLAWFFALLFVGGAFAARRFLFREVVLCTVAIFAVAFFAFGAAYPAHTMIRRSDLPTRVAELKGAKDDLAGELAMLGQRHTIFMKAPEGASVLTPVRFAGDVVWGVPTLKVKYEELSGVRARQEWASVAEYQASIGRAMRRFDVAMTRLRPNASSGVVESGFAHLPKVLVYSVGPGMAALALSFLAGVLGSVALRERSAFRRKYA
jgi:hypothetical protein